MIVKELIEKLKEFPPEFPVQLQVIEDGITYADDIYIEKAEKYDGDRIWIYNTERHNPEWMINSKNL